MKKNNTDDQRESLRTDVIIQPDSENFSENSAVDESNENNVQRNQQETLNSLSDGINAESSNVAVELDKEVIFNHRFGETKAESIQKTQETIFKNSSDETNAKSGNVKGTCDKNDGKCCKWSLEPLKGSRTYLNTRGLLSEDFDVIVEGFKQ